MEFLPPEIVNEILLLVDRPTIYYASQVCSQWRILSLKQVKTIKVVRDLQKICKEGDRLSYMKSKSKLHVTWIDNGFDSACEGGHKEFVELMIAKGACNFDYGLRGACTGGLRELVELMIDKGGDDWNLGLYGACGGGHKDLAELMITKGADDWNNGLYRGCDGGHKDIVELMILKGANRCRCGKPIRAHQ